ncbi:protein disulfide-isomerase precursor [Chytriomyces hyalinus]|nr:protein disulfide-isomerase precursor [Chytriomyces hyalinus]
MQFNPTSTFAALLLAAVTAFAQDHSHDDAAAASDVVTLTDKTFSSFVKQESLSLVEFYAPWCYHCKALAPEYELAATELKADNIKIAKVDCTVEKDTCSEVGVNGYPTLKVFRNGVAAEYKGERKAPSIVSTMKKQALPALSVITSDEIEAFKNKDKVVVIGYFADTTSNKFKPFEAVANQLRDDYTFAYTTDKVDGVRTPAVTLFKKFDEGVNNFSGKFSENELSSFIKTSSVPLIDEIGPENYQKYVQSGVPLGFLFVENEEQRTQFAKELTSVAQSAKGKVAFVFIDATKFGSHAKNLNLKEGQWPAFAINVPEKGLKFPFKGTGITADSLQPFVHDFVSGKLTPDLKSGDIPASNNDPVKVVVGKNFNDIVLDKTKDVFLEVYAPWCGHCKTLAPIWEELAELLSKKDSEFVTLAKMDGTENDFPTEVNVQVQGFPTLKLWRAETNEIVDYESSDRTLESLLAWLKKNAANGSKISASANNEEDGHDEL